MTECSQTEFEFQGLFSREVIGRFDGGQITSDGGSLLLREVEGRTGILRRLAGCFTDHRAVDRIEHSVEELIAQRIYALALGYEDLNDHEQLRADPLVAVLAGKRDPEGKDRKQERDRGKALAGKSTLNRWELTRADATEQERYAKIVMDPAAIDQLLVEVFLEAHATPPTEMVLDLDATDDPLYGQQEGRFFHGYYGHYCYLPCTSSRAIICCAHGCGQRIQMPRRAAGKKLSASCNRFVRAGQKCGSCCVPTPVSAETI